MIGATRWIATAVLLGLLVASPALPAAQVKMQPASL